MNVGRYIKSARCSLSLLYISLVVDTTIYCTLVKYRTSFAILLQATTIKLKEVTPFRPSGMFFPFIQCLYFVRGCWSLIDILFVRIYAENKPHKGFSQPLKRISKWIILSQSPRALILKGEFQHIPSHPLKLRMK